MSDAFPAPGSRRAAQAVARFLSLDAPGQLELARHVSKSRGRALVQQHAALRMVTAGYRARRAGRGDYALHPLPVVILVVQEKQAEDALGTDEVLPRHVFVDDWAGAPGMLLAVPTDVQPAKWFQGAVARAAGVVDVQVDAGPEWPACSDRGTLTCAVRLDTDAGSLHFGLSALHVLSPSTRPVLPAPDAGARLAPCGGDGNAIGASAPWGGHLQDASTGATSFDAQLAALADAAWFCDAHQGLRLSPTRPCVPSREAFEALAPERRFLVLAGSNHPLRLNREERPVVAQFNSYAYHEVLLGYKVLRGGFTSIMDVSHAELLRLQVSEDSPPPHAGDSGAAVVTWWPDGEMTLAGMFIASHEGELARTIYVLPAWQLFKLRNWRALPPGTTGLTPSFTCP